MHLPGFHDSTRNYLPKDGTVTYLPEFYSLEEARALYQILEKEINWKLEKIKMYGKEYDLPRLSAWYGETSYTYSGITMNPNPWTPTLLSMKKKLEDHTGEKFNSLLLNFYRSGNDHMSWHADNEKELGKNPFIASISLGDIRSFQMKHRHDKEIGSIAINLEVGSLVIMAGEMQHFWLHKIAATKKNVGPRINLTFRKMMTP